MVGIALEIVLAGAAASVSGWLREVGESPVRRAWLRAEAVGALLRFVRRERDARVQGTRLELQVRAASAAAVPGRRRGQTGAAGEIRGEFEVEGLQSFLTQVVEVSGATTRELREVGQLSVLGALRRKIALCWAATGPATRAE